MCAVPRHHVLVHGMHTEAPRHSPRRRIMLSRLRSGAMSRATNLGAVIQDMAPWPVGTHMMRVTARLPATLFTIRNLLEL